MSTRNIFLISVAIFTGLLFIVPRTFIPAELGNTVLTVVAFLFGIIAGFYIVVTTTDYNSVKNILATEAAGWISLHQNVVIYDRQFAGKLALLIDAFIRHAFDFEIIDYAKSTNDKFKSVEAFMIELPYNKYFDTLHGVIRENMGSIIAARQQLTVLGTKCLSAFQWIILWALAFSFIFSLYGLRTGELFFDVVTVVISSSAVLLLLLIRDLDLYVWNEKTFCFDIFENIFKSIGQLPYYPAEAVEVGRVYPSEKEYRIGRYADFPKSTERKIEIIKSS
ncbi:hypothetical protein A3C86_04140 [Candidatus Kaiserbacteria bacterium RIFCSPHIGHO2_02_FULL_49_16]|uniref:DUF4239 domain-containing protein n=1 Tax=Candidatus Kaiserbacteria bacterium RIFCSPHIGHO2_02_FULL_49_16 TaxID=1798490 RepID=A0A1F6DI64_9BACT|nr:MAG: hypothetical protein A3C86_04140 [Candidatus Kaiserbacteria bacterium RIFCSPHIGHO2_02_FULL_49_16]